MICLNVQSQTGLDQVLVPSSLFLAKYRSCSHSESQLPFSAVQMVITAQALRRFLIIKHLAQCLKFNKCELLWQWWWFFQQRTINTLSMHLEMWPNALQRRIFYQRISQDFLARNGRVQRPLGPYLYFKYCPQDGSSGLTFSLGPEGIPFRLHSTEPRPRQASLEHILSGRWPAPQVKDALPSGML